MAVIDSSVESNDADSDQRQRKWSALAADMIEARLFTGGERLAPPLYVTDRRNMKLVLDEHDLRLAGVVDGETAHRVGKLLAVQGLVVSRITILIDYDRSTKRSIDWGRMLTGAVRDARERKEQHAKPDDRRTKSRRPLKRRWIRKGPRDSATGGDDPRRSASSAPVLPRFHAKEIEEISRYLTVQCSFSLIDAVTGRTVVRHSPPPYRKTDQAAPRFAFGNLVSESELNPVDHFIGELVERAANEFVGMIVPLEREYRYTVVGKGKEGEAGIRALRADDYEQALAHFQSAHRRDPDKPEIVFALGVTCELLGRWEEALQYYRQATGMEDLDDDELAVYQAAKVRLAEHLERIVPPGEAVSQPGDERAGEPADVSP